MRQPTINPDGVSIKGCSIIYAPAGQAGEYARLATNPYRGCGLLKTMFLQAFSKVLDVLCGILFGSNRCYNTHLTLTIPFTA